MLRDLFLQLGEKIEGVERFQLVEVGVAEFLENFAVQSGEENLLVAVFVRGIGGAGGERFAEFVLALLVFFQNFAGALDHAAGKSGESGDFDAVAFVGTAGFDASKKNNFAGCFFDGDVHVFYRGEKFGKLGQFMIVRGEERAGTGVLLKMLDNGPGDGEAIERGGAAADFVEEDQARRRGVIENRRYFAHLHEKGRTAAREIVAGPDAREDAIRDGQLGLPRGNKGTHLGHENDERGLAKVGGLAAYVLPGDQEKLLPTRFETEVVGNKSLALLAEELFDDGMTPSDNQELPRGIEFRACVAAVGGKLGKRGQHVELRDRAGRAAQARGLCGDAGADVHEELALNFQDALVGGKDFAFILLEFRGSEALGVDESLLSLVIVGREMQIRFRNLNVVTEDLVEPNLQ